MKRITKIVSQNLYGETRKQAKSRLLNQRIKAALSGKSRDVSYGAGTTPYQKQRRYNILRKAGLPLKTPKYSQIFN